MLLVLMSLVHSVAEERRLQSQLSNAQRQVAASMASPQAANQVHLLLQAYVYFQ
jgi:hypothetical protein